MLNSLLHNLERSVISLIVISFFIGCSKPDFNFADGSNGKLSDLEGRWLVVNYWADWCPPCIKEMPELTSFYNDNKEEVLVLAFNFDELEGEELEEQIIRFKVNIPSLLTNPGLLFGWEAPPSLPTTYILDKKGKLRETLIGPQTQESLEALIKGYQESY
ncbi:MAG TPA: TlpA family protein disulfide reductase [Gammaproteobacteria bacterium]|jgi:thiol-disulfide isomerase/thioredoxin|nr:TlpA family protein disulfide reductase [Gammaproteobacteria bacterium]HIK72423.1 TlpA family protein disulfide reductase [Gammaproteobacteria bacterium]